MSNTRVMVICLDGYDAALSDRLIAEGKLSGLARLKAQSARFELEHGADRRARHTGLTWEHFSSGCTPETSEKWSAISFDPKTFRVWQSHATERPFLADVDARCVVFDVPYFDLRSAPNGTGMVGWSGHDVGVRAFARPAGLDEEIGARFGPPPGSAGLNDAVYPSVEATRGLAARLGASIKARGDIAEWLFGERLADWDVALLGFGEPHDAIELLYHGVDPGHPLAGVPSAKAARDGLTDVYEAISAQIERLMARFPDAAFVAFTMHGMGANDTDLPTMLLLPELMYRIAFQRPLFRSRADWRANPPPTLRPDEDWNASVLAAMRHPWSRSLGALPARVMRKLAVKAFAGRADADQPPAGTNADRSIDVGWMPAAQYASYWPRMDAFALPTYFYGQVRVNLRGREIHGRVRLDDYGASLDRIEAVLRACVDNQTGAQVVREFLRPGGADPMSLGPTQADLTVVWNGSALGFRHELYGDIGPAPVRRSGGHTGGRGALYIRSGARTPGDYGVRSSFDVAPTILDLLGVRGPNRIDGTSVLSRT